MYTPALQLNASYTSGIAVARRPPKIMALIATPFGSSQAGSIVGHCDAGAVNRALGCEGFAPVFLPISGVHRLPCQSRHSAGGSSVMPSHHTPRSGVNATFVKIVFLRKRRHGIWVRLLRRSGSDAEKTGFWIDSAQASVLVGPDPGDIISDRPDLPAFRIPPAGSAWRGSSCRTRSETRPRRTSSRPAGFRCR